MNRRDFLQRLLGTAAGAALCATLDVEKLLWIPGARTIFIPPAPTLYENTFVTADWMAREALYALKNQLAIFSVINREYEPIEPGSRISIRLLRQFDVVSS